MTNFGQSFKKARESKGISLDQIAKETRISSRFLTAIENEQFHLLPGGIFNRGFVRTFAAAVGLDADQAVSDYERLATAREPNDILTSANAQPSKSERHLYPVAIGVLALAIAIFYVVTRDSSPGAEAPASGLAPAISEPAPAPSSPEVPEISSPPPAEPEPTAVSFQGITLDVEAHQQTWIKVTSDGNSVNSGEVLEPGMTRKFMAESSINISIGNAAGLSLKINDMPVKPLGKSGEVRSVTITSANLKDFIS
jgi:cytoskeletal protein RodZ